MPLAVAPFLMKKTYPRTDRSSYIALLRGINLGGHKMLKMDQLRKAFEELGFSDVKTYIQSGNVVFKGPVEPPEILAKRIETRIDRQFGFPVPVVVKTAEEIGEIIRNNRLLQEEGIDPSHLHVTFLGVAPEKSALKMLDAIDAAPDQFRCAGKVVYLHCPDGYGHSKLTNNVLERVLKAGATTRNWKTVNQLYQMTLG